MNLLIKGKTLKEVRRLLEPMAYKPNDAAMIVLFHEPGYLSGAIKQVVTDSEGNRRADALHSLGHFKGISLSGSNGVEICFTDSGYSDGKKLFWETVNKLAESLKGSWVENIPTTPPHFLNMMLF